jgi:antitoxin (DNA-binding transcriptional repressor) of toxin-antitoxin stability system
MVMKASTQPEVRTIAAGEFKAKCLKLMDEALITQRPLTVTKRGKVVGKFVPEPPEEKPFRSLFGRTPDIRIPSEAEWRKLKDEWADEWERSTESFARELGKTPGNIKSNAK